jgi:hypothetical protein
VDFVREQCRALAVFYMCGHLCVRGDTYRAFQFGSFIILLISNSGRIINEKSAADPVTGPRIADHRIADIRMAEISIAEIRIAEIPIAESYTRNPYTRNP